MEENTRKRIWAIANDIWPDKEYAELYTHSFTIVRFGKVSFKELSDDEGKLLVSWLESIQEKKNATT
jgi:hypothetical protein